MKAIIIAAGYSTRLYPLTIDMPKQLLQVGPKLMVEHIIDKINQVKEIDEIIIVVNDKFYSKFLEWKNGYKGTAKKIILINDGTRSNEERLGAIGDLHLAIVQGNIHDGVLIIGGDNLFDFDLNDLLSLHKEKGHPVIAARDLGDPAKLAKKFGTIEMNDENIITGFEEKPEKPKTSLCATLIYYLTKEDVQELEDLIAKKSKLDNTGEFIKHLSKKKPVACFTFQGMWYDIGSHEELKEVNELYRKR